MRAVDESHRDVVLAGRNLHWDLLKALQDLLPAHVVFHIRESQIFRAADAALELDLAIHCKYQRRSILQSPVVQSDRLLVEAEAEPVLAVGREAMSDLHRVACAQPRRER